MFSISVIICTRNPREDYFRRVLEALRAQSLPKNQWELILIGVSEDQRFDLSWHPNVRYVPEERVGLAQARMTGTVASQSDLLIFVDDDNVLRFDYLETALKLSQRQGQHKLGAYGGTCIPDYEIDPPKKLRPHLAGLLVDKAERIDWCYRRRANKALPAGAGLVVRKEVALCYREQALNHPLRGSLGPHNKPPRGCDDSDLALCAIDLGFCYGMFPELELTHLIPAKKLNLENLEKLYESFGYGGRLLEAFHDPDGTAVEGELRLLSRHSRPSRLEMYARQVYMLLTGSSRAERRIRLAKDRGALRALDDLARLGITMDTDGIIYHIPGRPTIYYGNLPVCRSTDSQGRVIEKWYWGTLVAGKGPDYCDRVKVGRDGTRRTLDEIAKP